MIGRVHRQNQDGQARSKLARALQHVEAAAVRQRQIKDHHVPHVRKQRRDRFASRADVVHDRAGEGVGQQLAKTAAHDRMIVHEEHT
jgi:hypothetical protein